MRCITSISRPQVSRLSRPAALFDISGLRLFEQDVCLQDFVQLEQNRENAWGKNRILEDNYATKIRRRLLRLVLTRAGAIRGASYVQCGAETACNFICAVS